MHDIIVRMNVNNRSMQRIYIFTFLSAVQSLAQSLLALTDSLVKSEGPPRSV